MSILYTLEAEFAIEEVGEYSREHYQARGEAYMAEMQRVIERLLHFPKMGHEVPGRGDGTLRIRHERHFIFYEVLPSGDVLIVDVLHERQVPKSQH